jgi:ABC-type transport system substrate-binding protein
MQLGYWETFAQARASRRRIMAGIGAGALGSALAAACGGGDSKESTAGASESSGLVVKVQDETASLVRGGIYKSILGTPPSLDPHFTGPQTTHCWLCYSQLLRTKPGHMKNTNGEVDPELLESWEISPDKLTLTGKLAQTSFGPVKPVDGRQVDVQDVLFSWERYKTQSPRRTDLSYDANNNAPVLSVAAPDARTVVIKLARPYAPIFSALSAKFNGTYYVVPKEAANTGALDLKGTVVGTGPFYMSEWVPTTRTSFRRNPGFKMDKRNVPYMDGADFFDLPEYATQLAQFKAGAVHDSYGNFRQDDILPTKRDVPELEIQAGGNDSTGLTGAQIRAFFGQASDSPFKDERVRQAFVLTWDRELFIETSYNVAAFRKEGLPMETILVNGLRDQSWPGWMLDPLSKDFGPNTRYFKPDLAEAKKLVTAAGFPNGVEHDLFSTGGYGAAFQKNFDILVGMSDESKLFKSQRKVLDFSSVWNITFRNNRGEFSGASFILDINELDPVVDLFGHYHPSGSKFFGSDATMNGMLEKMVGEFDNDKRKAMVHDFERYEGGKNFQPLPGGATTFRITWPALRNKFVWQGDSQGRYLSTLWLDQTKPPFKKA